MKRNRRSLAHALPNSRLEVSSTASPEQIDSALKDFHIASFHLTLHGAFNVNSVSVDSWASMLAGTRRVTPAGATTGFTRIQGEDPRILTDGEIRRLAAAIVAEVKQRGPFLGMSDFVNRRLAPGATGKRGAIEAAIEVAGLNLEATGLFPLLDTVPAHSHPSEIPAPLPIDPALKPGSTAWGRNSFLTQADVLQVIGDSLVARSDTFVIRAYGESNDNSGRPRARAWCEAVVQRVATPVKADATGINPDLETHQTDFGRQFRQITFRWLNPREI